MLRKEYFGLLLKLNFDTMIDIVNENQLESIFGFKTLKIILNHLDKENPLRLNESLVSKCDLEEIKKVKEICSIKGMIYDIYRIKHEENYDYLVIPLLKFYESILRVTFTISTLEFNNLNGNIIKYLVDRDNFLLDNYDLTESVKIEGNYITHAPSGYFNYEKYLNTDRFKYNSKIISLFEEMEKWLLKDINSNIINFFSKNVNHNLENNWNAFHAKRKHDLEEKLDWFGEMWGLSMEDEKLDELNESGLSDFDEDNYWNID